MADELRPGVGIALSGGGFRATLFHLGALWRLNELGWLTRFAEITSVSGGSITAAVLALKWNSLAFDDRGVASNLEELVVEPLREFCGRTIDVGGILAGVLSPFHHPSQLIERAYSKHLFGAANLNDLPTHPRFTIYATSLQSGRSVRFQRGLIRDYTLGKAKAGHVRIATAVAASSAFPPPLCPVSLELPAEAWTKTEGADLYNQARMRTDMRLGDGGIYDNMGLQRVAGRYETVLVSDAGAPFAPVERSYAWRFSQLARAKRALSIITDQARGIRKYHLIRDLESGRMQGTYWGIGTQIVDYRLRENGLEPALCGDTSVTAHLARMRTRLNKFNATEQERLINWSYALTDAGMRRHVLAPGAEVGAWPCPKNPL